MIGEGQNLNRRMDKADPRNFEHRVNSAVVKRDAEIQKALAAKKKAEEDAKKKAEAAKAAAKPPVKK